MKIQQSESDKSSECLLGLGRFNYLLIQYYHDSICIVIFKYCDSILRFIVIAVNFFTTKTMKGKSWIIHF